MCMGVFYLNAMVAHTEGRKDEQPPWIDGNAVVCPNCGSDGYAVDQYGGSYRMGYEQRTCLTCGEEYRVKA